MFVITLICPSFPPFIQPTNIFRVPGTYSIVPGPMQETISVRTMSLSLRTL